MMKWMLLVMMVCLTACSSAENVDINRVDIEWPNEEIYMLHTPEHIESIYGELKATDESVPKRPKNVTVHLYFPSVDADEVEIYNIWYIDGGKALFENVHTEEIFILKKSATTSLKQLIDCDDCQLAP